jgi:hypothetical protein
MKIEKYLLIHQNRIDSSTCNNLDYYEPVKPRRLHKFTRRICFKKESAPLRSVIKCISPITKRTCTKSLKKQILSAYSQKVSHEG